MAQLSGFWSYVHADDETEGGRIVQLGRDVVAKYEMLTGDSIQLFLDRDDLEWGDQWRTVIDESLAAVAFFIPILTPRYFQSAECRHELQQFARKARDLGVRELVMPIKYVDFPALNEDQPSDELIALVKDFQWEDWTDLAYVDPTAETYRRGVSRLAQRLVDANRSAEAADVSATAEELADGRGGDDETAGTLDRMAAAETTLPEWAETVQNIVYEIEAIGSLMESAGEDMQQRDNRGAGFAGRLHVARHTASELSPRAEEILRLSTMFTNQLHEVDSGIRAIIDEAPSEVENHPEQREQACEFFQSVTEMAESAQGGLDALKGMIDAIQPMEGLSRDLRPPFRTLRQGLTAMHEGRAVIDEWLRLIAESPLECD